MAGTHGHHETRERDLFFVCSVPVSRSAFVSFVVIIHSLVGRLHQQSPVRL